MKTIRVMTLIVLSLGALALAISGLVMALNDNIGQQIASPESAPTAPAATVAPIAPAAQPDIPATAKDGLQIVALGDSLTVGIGDETNNGGYVGVISSELGNPQVINHASSGARAPDLLQTLSDPLVLADVRTADVVLLSIGGNDLHRGGETLANLEAAYIADLNRAFTPQLNEIFAILRAANDRAPIYLLGLYDPFRALTDNGETGRYVRQWNESVAAEAETFERVLHIPTFDIFQLQPESFLAADMFHPNARGYRKIAERILATLEQPEVTR
jgi:lysophospholipase L1-like esterase